MNVVELCNYLDDSLLKLFDGPFHVYVPTVIYACTFLQNCSRTNQSLASMPSTDPYPSILSMLKQQKGAF